VGKSAGDEGGNPAENGGKERSEGGSPQEEDKPSKNC